MAKTIKDILEKENIVATRPKNELVYLGEDSVTGELYPFKFAQNGKAEMVEYMDFGTDVIDTIKFLAPNSQFYKTLSHVDAFRDCDPTTRVEDAKMFAFEWTAMFDQLKTIPSDVKDAGGLFVFPNVEYFEKRLEDISAKRETLTNVRREFSKVIRDCIAHNYAEVERLNKDIIIDEARQIKLPERSKGLMKKIAVKEGTVKESGKGGKGQP